MRSAGVAVAIGLAGALLLAGCAAESTDAGTSPSRTPRPSASPSPSVSPSASATASPIPSPSIVPGPEPTGTPDPLPTATGSADGWTYAQLKQLCVDWVTNRSPKNDNERWAFDTGEPAQKYSGAWNFSFYGTFDNPDIGLGIQSAISCGVTGTPGASQVGASEALGDALPDALLYP